MTTMMMMMSWLSTGLCFSLPWQDGRYRPPEFGLKPLASVSSPEAIPFMVSSKGQEVLNLGLVPVMTQKFCGLTGKLNFCPLWTVMLQSKLNVLGQARYLGSHQTCGRVCAIAMLLNGKLLSLTILKTGLCTKGYVIGSMEKSNLQRHPIMLVRLFSLMAMHVKPGNWLTNSRPVRKITRLWKN